MKDTRSVLLISDGSRWGELAHDFLRRRFADVDWFAWDYGDPVTRSFDQWHGCDLLKYNTLEEALEAMYDYGDWVSRIVEVTVSRKVVA